MLIRYSKNFEKGKKELNKKHKVEEINMLDSIVKLIKRSDTYELMKNSPLAYLYGFEDVNMISFFTNSFIDIFSSLPSIYVIPSLCFLPTIRIFILCGTNSY